MPATKVTVTLPVELLAAVDRYVAEHRGTTRSGLCARALLACLQQLQEDEIERYYSGMPEDERADYASWADAAARSGARLWG